MWPFYFNPMKSVTTWNVSELEHINSNMIIKYELILSASDSLNENFTKICITVRDKNDLPPSFPEKLYPKTMDEEILAPFQMIQVKALDYTYKYLTTSIYKAIIVPQRVVLFFYAVVAPTA